MSKTFGNFVKEKRMKNDFSLKEVAETIGISAVYQSSIEAGKRPAPSYNVLVKLGKVLMLKENELDEMFDLAAKSKKSKVVAYDIADYINENEYINKAIRYSKKKNIPQSEWINFINTMSEKYS
ncbi:helix-turn-helix domain-containing protein [Ruminococcus sp.]|mgnify:CR=1 FL=1|uniref:helix-turn-helix domain-containing protein n=1 Tax=Ruminococcus sp. TaxID=41978 RepID=UPI0038676590